MEMQSKCVYFGYTHQGDDMAEIQGDREKLKEALMLLMDRRWGLKRIDQAMMRIRMLPRYTRPFVGTASPCNYLQQVVKDEPDNAIPVLELLSAIKRRHASFWADFDKENEQYAKRHKILVTNTRRLRLCYQQAYVIEAYKLGRSLTKQEQLAVAKRYNAMWVRWREEYIDTHPNEIYREQLKGSATARDERMQALYNKVISSPEQFGIKQLSDIAEARKLRHMEKHDRES